MPSLTEHLRRPADHGRLPFHPECPVCCEQRLAGALPSDALVGRRVPALAAAGVLAFSTAAPATTLGSEPEQGPEGAAAPEKAAADEYEGESEMPELNPDGGNPDPDPESGVVPELPPDGDAPEPEAEAPKDAPPPAPEPGAEEPPEPNPQPAPAPDAGATTPTPTPLPDAPTPDAAPTHARAAESPIGKVSSGPPLKSFVERQARDRSAPTATSAQAEPAALAQSSPATVLVSEQRSAAEPGPMRAATTGAHSRGARPGDRTHVVATGESLWSIAADHLGGDAAIAATAREVNRLWELNARRIGTGDPSLIHAGTTLLL